VTASLAMAGPGDQPAPEATTSYGAHIITGTVVSSDDGNLVLDTSQGGVYEFAFNEAGQYGAAMFPGDDVRVYYEWEPERGNVVERVQTLNVTQKLDRSDRSDAMRAMSLPPTDGGDEELFAQAERTTTERTTTTTRSTTTTSTTQTDSRDLLPATASPIPAIGLLGMVFLGISAGAHALRRSRSTHRRDA
jgi:hypothetical protein